MDEVSGILQDTPDEPSGVSNDYTVTQPAVTYLTPNKEIKDETNEYTDGESSSSD